MGVIIWIIFGGLVGWCASLVMNTNKEQGAVLNVVIGVVGAIAGGGLMSFLGESGVSGFNFYSFLVALLGSVFLIVVVKSLQKV